MLAIDQRGHGDSEWSRDVDYTNHTMALDEIARRIAEDRHLRKHQELRTRRDRAGDCIGVLDFVGGEIADFRVDLGQCDLQRAGSYDARAQRDAGRAG